MSGEEDGEQRRRYLRWSDELQAAYLAALEQCGGLQNARPKALLDLLQPRFPVLTLQHVKNHLQKQRTKEAKAGAGGAPPRPSPVTRNKGRATERDAAAAARGDSGDAPAPGPPAAPGPTLWLPDSFAQQQPGDVPASESDALIALARRALTTTVHQLALFRKLLEELEEAEDDHAQLLAALRHDPSGRSLLLGARDDAAGGDSQPERLRRLLPRLLPPNPFSSGPKAEAAMKLAAWMAATERDATGAGMARSQAGLATLESGANTLRHGGGSTEPLAAAADAAAVERGGSGDGAAAAQQPMLQPRKRHKALSELLAEIPLGAPPAPAWPAAAPGGPTATAAAGPALEAQLAGGGAGVPAQGLAPLPAPLPQQDARPPQQAQQAPGGPNPFGGPAWQARPAQGVGGDVAMQQARQPAGAEDSLMLCSLDAKMSSLLLHSMSQVMAQAARAAGGGGAAEPLAAPPPPPPLADLALGIGKEQLPADQMDLSVLRSVLDMLSSGSAHALLATSLAPAAPGAPGSGGGAASGPALPGADGGHQGPGGHA